MRGQVRVERWRLGQGMRVSRIAFVCMCEEAAVWAVGGWETAGECSCELMVAGRAAYGVEEAIRRSTGVGRHTLSLAMRSKLMIALHGLHGSLSPIDIGHGHSNTCASSIAYVSNCKI